MYLGIDVGGTKTLVASLDDQGNITEKTRFPTDHDYQKFLKLLSQAVEGLPAKDFVSCGIGIPSTQFDRSRGVGISFGNLPWKNATVQADVAALAGCPVLVENDAKLAGLSEAILLKDTYKRVLYVTVSTGIGFALIVDGVIDTSFGDGGGRTFLLEHEGKMVPWETFASGKAIVERYGKRASEITDPATWRQICHDLAQGLVRLIEAHRPEIIVIGGSVGTHFEKYGDLLTEELKKYPSPQVPLPMLAGARHPEEAVILGCYEYIRQKGDDGSHNR